MAGGNPVHEQALADEIEHLPFAPLQVAGGMGVGITHQLQHRRRRKIKDDQRDDGNGGVKGVHFPQFTRPHSAHQQSPQGPGPRNDIFAEQPFRRLAALHHQLLEQRRVAVPVADEIKMQIDVAQQQGSRRARRIEDGQRLAVELPQLFLDDGHVKVLLAIEIVVEQRLVHAGGGGDGVRAGARQPVPGKDALGGSENFRA